MTWDTACLQCCFSALNSFAQISTDMIKINLINSLLNDSRNKTTHALTVKWRNMRGPVFGLEPVSSGLQEEADESDNSESEEEGDTMSPLEMVMEGISVPAKKFNLDEDIDLPAPTLCDFLADRLQVPEPPSLPATAQHNGKTNKEVY
jgi:hypothetical protein